MRSSVYSYFPNLLQERRPLKLRPNPNPRSLLRDLGFGLGLKRSFRGLKSLQNSAPHIDAILCRLEKERICLTSLFHLDRFNCILQIINVKLKNIF